MSRPDLAFLPCLVETHAPTGILALGAELVVEHFIECAIFVPAAATEVERYAF